MYQCEDLEKVVVSDAHVVIASFFLSDLTKLGLICIQPADYTVGGSSAFLTITFNSGRTIALPS